MTTAPDRLSTDLRRARECAADLGLKDDETLILTGSATLPFPTRGGDIDLVLVTPSEDRYLGFAQSRERERETEQAANEFAISYVQLPNGKEMDIEVWPARRLVSAAAGVGGEIRDIQEVEADFTRVGGLDVKVGTDLFHALGWGCPWPAPTPSAGSTTWSRGRRTRPSSVTRRWSTCGTRRRASPAACATSGPTRRI